ncbi:MAG: hypothetical protein BJ554DRAFT_6393 [Olpidium bornovanus]|uniref:Uncharacterized protein n=1 Tax=Olpidium bornovanus TaxID=278681 RepID=A0A8H8DK80_9FUNG|nr:MAG: hypothetical protein BJ554DRAFT_6393 [Olpidium bornovanus]
MASPQTPKPDDARPGRGSQSPPSPAECGEETGGRGCDGPGEDGPTGAPKPHPLSSTSTTGDDPAPENGQPPQKRRRSEGEHTELTLAECSPPERPRPQFRFGRSQRSVDAAVASRIVLSSQNVVCWGDVAADAPSEQVAVQDEQELCLVGFRPGEVRRHARGFSKENITSYDPTLNLVFQGVVLVSAFVGSVSICGHTLRGSDGPETLPPLSFFPAYSPRSHALLTIEPVEQPRDGCRRATSELIDPAADRVARRVRHMWDVLRARNGESAPFAAVVVLRGLAWCGANQLWRVSREYRELFRSASWMSLEFEHLIKLRGFYPVSILGFCFPRPRRIAGFFLSVALGSTRCADSPPQLKTDFANNAWHHGSPGAAAMEVRARPSHGGKSARVLRRHMWTQGRWQVHIYSDAHQFPAVQAPACVFSRG